MPWLLKIFPSMENPISPSLLSPALQIEQTDNRERDQRGEEPSPFHRSFWVLEFTVDVGLLCWPRFVLGHFLDFAVSSSSTSRQNASDRLVVAIAQASASAFSCRGIQPKRGNVAESPLRRTFSCIFRAAQLQCNAEQPGLSFVRDRT
jgi:hypothetical protein